jgi:hypothetical protein
MIMRGAMSAYPSTLVRGSRLMRRRRGLGQSGGCMSSSDFQAAIGGPDSCGPYDNACMVCNTQRANAISNLMDSGCVAPGTPISFSCDTSQDAINAFMNNNPLAVNATVGSGSTSFVATGPQVTMQPPGTSAGNFWGGSSCPSLIFFNGVCANPAANVPANTTPQSTGANPGNGVSQQSTMTQTTPGWNFRAHRPQIVNPSPAGTLTATASSSLNPNSVLNQANGTTPVVSTVPVSTGDWFTDPTQEIISGLPNWAVVAMAGGGLFLAISLANRR